VLAAVENAVRVEPVGEFELKGIRLVAAYAAISGTSLSAQARYAAGTREILECWFEKRPIREEYLIVSLRTVAGHVRCFADRSSSADGTSVTD
jgi:hypothetical protein